MDYSSNYVTGIYDANGVVFLILFLVCPSMAILYFSSH
uniref:Uncharacterized protein n=1 Tax=Rhizophora mucronata TaxID=61149 RepID=A0A2P2PNN7_RHIMU